MFLGQTQTHLENGRLSLPPAFQNFIKGGVYITQGFDQNLLVLTTSAFEAMVERITALNMANPVVRMLQRLLLGSASFLEIGAERQITLPEALTQYAGLTSNVIIVGQGDYMEVWSSDQWQKQQQQIRETLASGAQSFAEFTITTR